MQYGISQQIMIEAEQHMDAIRRLLESNSGMLNEETTEHVKDHADKVLAIADSALARAKNSDSITAKQMILKPVMILLSGLLTILLGSAIGISGFGFIVSIIGYFLSGMGIGAGIGGTILGLGLKSKITRIENEIKTAKMNKQSYKNNKELIDRLDAKAKALTIALDHADQVVI